MGAKQSSNTDEDQAYAGNEISSIPYFDTKLPESPKSTKKQKAFFGGDPEPEPGAKTFVTSRVIHWRPEGNYPFDEAGWLIPHEAVRREFMRADLATTNLDILTKPWQIILYERWLNKFLIPFIHDHHDNEEFVCTPFFAKHNIITPPKQHTDHVSLLTSLNEWGALAKELLMLSQGQSIATEEARKQFESKQQAMKDHFVVFKEQMFEHLAEEDEFGPQAYVTLGKNGCDELEKLILKEGLKKKGEDEEAFKMIACAVWSAMGWKSSLPNDYPSSPVPVWPQWASEEFVKEFEQKLPYPVREFLLPRWNKRYQKWCAVIETVAGSEDIYNLALGLDVTDSCAPGCTLA